MARNTVRKWILSFGAVFFAAIFTGLFLDLASVPSKLEITRALEKTILPEFACDDLPVSLAMQHLLDKLKQADPRMARVKLEFLDFPGGRSGAPLTLDLQDVTVAQAMHHCMAAANLRYMIRHGTICVFPLTSHGGPPLTPWEKITAGFAYWWWRMTNILR